METFDPVVLARMQFAANMTFHILFPTISISMGWALLFFKTRFVATGQRHWMDAYQFWVKIFALTFALGVVRASKVGANCARARRAVGSSWGCRHSSNGSVRALPSV